MEVKSVLTMALAGLVLNALLLQAAEERHDTRKSDAEWSEAVGGLRARILLKRSHVVNGTPIIATYLVLQNVSDVMNPLEFPWSVERMKFRVVDSNGKELPVGPVSYDGMFLSGDLHLVIPFDGELSFDISAHGAGIQGDKAALIDLTPMSTWTIEKGQRDHFLEAVLEVQKPNELREGVTRPWHGRIKLPRVLIPVQPDPNDPAPTEGRINELGAKLLHDDYRVSEEAERALSLIDDPRVIPWYVKALDSDRSSLKSSSLDKLARFNSDNALEGLKKGMNTWAADIGNATESQKEQAAAGVRHYASAALARSPHPKAKSLLITMRDDPYDAVRLNVLHVLGKMDTPASLDMIKAMTTDRSEMVRDEAKRYLKLRLEKGPAGPKP
jgi:hypothetical protein